MERGGWVAERFVRWSHRDCEIGQIWPEREGGWMQGPSHDFQLE